MDKVRVHRATSNDGTEIAGRVDGEGPPLVLVHGGLGDDLSWDSLLPLLTDSFTCHRISTRGRGLSGEPSRPDYSPGRLVEDVVAFTQSIGDSVGLIGHSLGGSLALAAAARSTAVSSVAVYEPAVFDVPSEQDPSRSGDKARRISEAVSEGRLADAARAMIEDVATDDELARLSASGAFGAMARNAGVALKEAQQASESEGPSPTGPSILAGITVAVLYLHGSITPTNWYVEGARYIAEHIADTRVVEIAGAGHFGPHLAPELLAEELVNFFGERLASG
jgi:pimeloyl-ACP methyl ester carboxylesterase